MLQLSDRSMSQLRVTAQFYLENKGKYILKAWKGYPILHQGYADSKDAKRRERERACKRASPGPLAPLFMFFSPWACPMETGLSRSAVCST